MLTPEQLSRIDSAHLPDHIAVIMDGNGRWAKRRRLPRVMGHRAGMKAVEELVNNCRQLEIRALTLYSFSSENWKRPQFEIEALMALLDEHLVKEIDRMERENIRFNTIGCIQALPDLVQEKIASAKDRTRKNNGMVLTLALSYGAREEIAEAARRLALTNSSSPAAWRPRTCPIRICSSARVGSCESAISSSGKLRTRSFTSRKSCGPISGQSTFWMLSSPISTDSDASDTLRNNWIVRISRCGGSSALRFFFPSSTCWWSMAVFCRSLPWWWR